MSVYAIYFSPTGGTKKVMDLLGAELGVEKVIDLSVYDDDYSAYEFKQGDVCLVGVPSFGGRVPDIVLENISVMKARRAVAIPVVVYGNRAYDDTLLELKNQLMNCGFKVPAAVAGVAEHSIMHQFGAGRPDAQDAEELKGFARKIKSLLVQLRSEASAPVQNVEVPGNRPYRKYGGVPFKPSDSKKCTHCGLCAEKCPVKAIPAQNPETVDADVCISCMRCVSICPSQARNLNKLVLAAASAKMKKACSTRKENELFI